MRHGKTIAQRAREWGLTTTGDDLVHDLLDRLVEQNAEFERAKWICLGCRALNLGRSYEAAGGATPFCAACLGITPD